MNVIRIATRRSSLALAQSRQVADLLSAAHSGLQCELTGLLTRGDTTRGSLAAAGGKGLFTAELEDALRAGRVDLAVHSAKDLPAVLPPDMNIVACPPREDARDALVSPGGGGPAALPANARVGTGSLRRSAQLRRLRPDVQIVPLRGNVETRLGKVQKGEVDAVILAMAGLNRSGLAAAHRGWIRPLDIETFLPAAGQGILALETLTEAKNVADLLAALDDTDTHAALLAERAIVRSLAADCTAPLGVYVYKCPEGWAGRAMVAGRTEDAAVVRVQISKLASAEEVGAAMIEQLLSLGAPALLRGGLHERPSVSGD